MKQYICIDLKSFYASVECVERGLDPLRTNLVVADSSRTEKTICLAVTPSLKAYGISGRARLFEVVQAVDRVNAQRKAASPEGKLEGESFDAEELKNNPSLSLSYIAAPPRMAHYMEFSTRIYNIYLKYVSSEDIHVYSIDEVFIDATNYLETYKLTARELGMQMINEVLAETGITATAGIGTNMYLAKIAMDIEAKHAEPDENGVRIAELDEQSYREKLWAHKPVTDFWRVGPGIAKRLESVGLYTMGDVAKCSVGNKGDFYCEDLLYKLLGINAELLIDHAWGWEPCNISDIKSYVPESKSISSGQVLHCPYTYEKAEIVVREMAELMALDLVDKGLVTSQLVLTVGYDIQNLSDSYISKKYTGNIKLDRYGRKVPEHARGTVNLPRLTSSSKMITEAVMGLYERIMNKKLLVRRINLSAANLVSEKFAEAELSVSQLDMFTDPDKIEEQEKEFADERKIQEAMLKMQKRYGKNAVLKGMNLKDGATTISRNGRIGGHKA